MTQDPGDREGLIPALRAVSETLGSFTLSHSGGDAERRALRSLVREYLVPRLLDPDSALVVAVVGMSGSGKSTLLNSLARRRISPSGPLRPTTTAPLVWSGEGLPPTLGGFPALLTGRGIVADPAPPEGLVLVDTPPPSVIGENGRPVAAAILEVADACLLVASGIRYADAAAWDLIDVAARRRLPSLFVLNRLSSVPEIQRLLQEDFNRRLVSRGVLRGEGRDGVIGVTEGPILPESGGLPPEWVTAVHKELESLADPLTRRATIGAAVSAATSRLGRGLGALRDALVDEAVVSLALTDALEAPYRAAAAELAGDLQAGRLAPLAAGPPGGLGVVVARRASRAARTVASTWEAQPAGGCLLAGRFGLWAHGPETAETAERLIGVWAKGLPSRAAEACGRTRLRRRRARREAEALRRASLDPGYRPGKGTVRRPAALMGVAVEMRRELAEVLRRVLDEDASRFRRLVGSPPSGALLTRLRLDGEAP
jgi:GTPase SAR1 family protein